MVSWDDGIVLMQVGDFGDKIKCQAAVISEAEVSNEDSVLRIQKTVIKELLYRWISWIQEQLRPFLI